MTKREKKPIISREPRVETMPNLTENTIKDLQKLCRLQLSQSEEKVLQDRLASIVKHVASLDSLDTKNTPPCIRVQQDIPKDSLREDLCENSLSKKDFLDNAPQSIGGMVQVPVVIEQEEKL